MTDAQQGSWYWPPAFRDAQQLLDFYSTVEIPDKAMFRFGNHYGRRQAELGLTGAEGRIPPHLMQTVIRAAMMRAVASNFPLSEQQLVNKYELPYQGGDERTVKWVALHYKTDELVFDALYGSVD